MKNAVGYCRFSSTNQREESIDAQKRAIKYFAMHEGYNIIRFYEDQAISGKTARRRPGFLQMIEDAKSKEFETVIVHKFDRFSRDLVDNFTYEKELKKSGVELISVMEKLDSTPAGKLMKVIIAGINSFYVDNLAVEVAKGLKENAYNCVYTGGTPPIGYDILDKRYIINEYEAEAVKIIFQMYGNENYGYVPIIRKLNALGFKTKAGNPFGKNSLYEIIRNERYKGVFVYNKHTARAHDGSRTRTDKDDKDIIRIPGGIPQIVSEELWERCNDRLARNRRNGGASKAKEMYLLSGLIFCGECGFRMHGNGRYPAPDRPKLITYRCAHRDQCCACKNKEIKRDDVENFVIDQLQVHLFSNKIIPQLTKQLNEYIQATTQSENHLPRYENRLKKLETGRSHIIEAVTKTGFTDLFAHKLAEIETEIQSINSMISKASNHQQIGAVTEDMVAKYLLSFKAFVLKRDKPQIKKFIDSFVERVDVYRESVKVTFKIILPTNQDKPLQYLFETNAKREQLKKKTA